MKYGWMLLMAMVVGCSPAVDSSQTADQTPVDPGKPSSKTYEVVELTEPDFQLDGLADEPAWNEANRLTDFVFPWKDQPAPPTSFRAFCDDENLYFLFEVEDADVVLDEKTEGEMALVGEDRVEIYFAPDLDLENYYSVEMDLLGRKLDYQAKFHRQFDFDWTFPELKTAGRRTEKGYVVEGTVPLKTLETMGLPSLDSGKLRAGFFRAEFSTTDGPKPLEAWISWVDPKTEAEDFHIPGTLGILKKAPKAEK